VSPKQQRQRYCPISVSCFIMRVWSVMFACVYVVLSLGVTVGVCWWA
jgi:hypothetical protein